MNAITKAYQNALRLPLTDSDRLVLISDCHRGDGTAADNFQVNRNLYIAALSHYLREGYTYIELGDGDELWENKSFCRVTEANGYVFRMLAAFCRENRLYMLYGNHDVVKRRKSALSYYDETLCRDRMLCAPVQEAICLEYDGQELLLLHGHQADPLNNRYWRLARFLVRHLWRPLELVGFRNPTSAAYNAKKQNKVETRLSQWAEAHGVLLFAGHTHRAAFSKPGEGVYFNDGSCVHPSGITAIELCDGAIRPVKWQLKTREDGTLYVGSVSLRPAVPLRRYFEG